MMGVLFYIAKLLLVSALLYGYYHLVLRNKQYHRYNRVFLLLTPVLALVMPLVHIPVNLLPAGAAGMKWLEALTIIDTHVWEPEGGVAAGVAGSGGTGWWTLEHVTGLLYGLGLAIALLLFVRSLIYIAFIRRRYRFERVSGVRLYHTREPGAPFSFFRSIFWLDGLAFGTREGQQIFRHELYHVTQRHSADNLFIELCCMICWFNPFFFLVRRELRAIHEFLADDHAIGSSDGLAYAELLVLHAIGSNRVGDVVSPMFQQTIKRRIAMITKKCMTDTRHGYFSRLMVVPVVAGLFCCLSFRVAMHGVGMDGGRMDGPGAVRPGAPVTVVIDAAHGGIDAGAMGAAGAAEEKVLALQLAKKIESMAASYNVKVVMTRQEDVLPGSATDKEQGLKNRVKIADEADARAFVSLHVNNTGKAAGTESGFEAFVSKRRDFRSSDLLASAILRQTAGIYTTKDAVFKRDEGIYVLDHTNCAAVIIECGYIDNPKDVQFFQSHLDAIARSILQGIVDWQGVK